MQHPHAGSRALACDHRARDCQGHEKWFLLHLVWRGEAATQRALLWEVLPSDTDCDLHIGSEGVLAGNGAQSYSVCTGRGHCRSHTPQEVPAKTLSEPELADSGSLPGPSHTQARSGSHGPAGLSPWAGSTLTDRYV